MASNRRKRYIFVAGPRLKGYTPWTDRCDIDTSRYFIFEDGTPSGLEDKSLCVRVLYIRVAIEVRIKVAWVRAGSS